MRILILLVFLTLSFNVFSQEITCRVSVVGDDFQNVDKEVFRNMGKAIEDLVNERSWTNNVFEEHEKIKMNLKVQITSVVSSDRYHATLLVQANRPVFNSTYPSLMYNFLDENLSFTYTEGSSLEFEDNTHTYNLSSVVAFYVYMIIGLDYDSFALNGGTKYYQKAEAVVNAAQSEDVGGWQSHEKGKKNRYWIAENALNSSFAEYRRAVYTYHRLGLDMMADKPEEARKKITQSLTMMEKAHKQNPSSIIIPLFFYAKSKELINIFSGAPANEQTRVIPILKKLDVSNAAKYDEISKGN